MATATGTLQQGLRGAIGDLIFRNYNGKTVVSLRPVYKNETKTEARRQTRNKFRDATNYASYAMEDIKLKAYYKQKARQLKVPNAYTAAITDYLRRAKVTATTRSTFAAGNGDIIYLLASKGVFSINKINVRLCNHQGEVLAERTLTKSNSEKSFELKYNEYFPDFASLKIITDEPINNEYVIPTSEFVIPG